MKRKEKPLPKPPSSAFGRRKPHEHEEEPGSLLADRMAAAQAAGKLDEFLKEEMPDNEYARNLAAMMMGMTGMMPGQPVPASGSKESVSPTEGATEVPEDIRKAIEGANVQGLMEMLRREHRKRNPEAAATEIEGVKPGSDTARPAPATTADMPAIDKELIDALIRIAQDNSVSLDWIILRAIKVYVEEYKKSGKL